MGIMRGRIAKASCLVFLAGGFGGCVTGGSSPDAATKSADDNIETYELDKATQGDLLDSDVQSDKAGATTPAATDKSDIPADVDTSSLTVDPLEEPAPAVQNAPADTEKKDAAKPAKKAKKKQAK